MPVSESSLSSGPLEQYDSLISVRGKQHFCRLCPYVTELKSRMQRHLRIHTGERPFKCHLCPKAFNVGSNFRRHVRTHTGERPVKCRFCPRAFRDSSSLKRPLQLPRKKKAGFVPATGPAVKGSSSLAGNPVAHVRAQLAAFLSSVHLEVREEV
nr:zinc finger protein 705A-like [Dermacentor andersoni]